MIHAVKAVFVENKIIEYRCTQCPFRGTLQAGVKHVVQNQFVVEHRPQKES